MTSLSTLVNCDEHFSFFIWPARFLAKNKRTNNEKKNILLTIVKIYKMLFKQAKQPEWQFVHEVSQLKVHSVVLGKTF